MKRIAIFGSPGSGKSTLARRLSALTGMPTSHLDTYYFNPGWEIKSADSFTASLTDVITTDHWITDGNYLTESVASGRIERADTLILLQAPRLLCLWRVLRRTVLHYGRVRPDQADGCPERFDWEFMEFVWNYPAKSERIRQMMLTQAADKTVLFLKGRVAVTRFLTAVQTENASALSHD